MKAGILRLKADCVLELTEDEAAILHHYTAYENKHLANHLATKVSGLYQETEIVEVLNSLQHALEKIMAATGKARENIFDERYSREGRRELRTE